MEPSRCRMDNKLIPMKTSEPSAPHRNPESGGWGKMPAPPYELCPKCGASNHGEAYCLWRVAYSAGTAFLECDVCSHSQRLTAGAGVLPDV